MPQLAPRPCTNAGCGVLVRDGTGRCPKHKVVEGRFGDKRRGSRQSRGYGAEWERTRRRILARDHGLCQPCLERVVTTQGTEVDHKLSKAEGGTDDDANLQTICRECHRAKTQAEAARARGLGHPRGVVESLAGTASGPNPMSFFCVRKF